MDRKAIIRTIVINPDKKETCLKLNASTANKQDTWLMNVLMSALKDSSVVIEAIEVMIDLQEEAMVIEELEVEGVAMVIEVEEAATSKEIITNLETIDR